MKIYLFLTDRIEKFSLPKDIAGSFSFDVSKDEESKLINIEARGNKWFLYSTEEVKLINDDGIIGEIEIIPNKYYYIIRSGIKYLIYISDLSKENINVYTYGEDLDLSLGNSDSTLYYNSNLIAGLVAKIHVTNGLVLLEKLVDAPIYVNNKILNDSAMYIENNTSINLAALKILFLKNYFIVIAPRTDYSINEEISHAKRIKLEVPGKEAEVPIKDRKLYNKKDYFLKSPRLRRIHEEKKIKLSQYPGNDAEKTLPLILTIGPMFTMGAVSAITVLTTVQKIKTGQTTWAQSGTALITSGAMLISMLLWPLVTNFYNKHINKKNKKKLNEKYNAYLKEKEEELELEAKLQTEILNENLFRAKECQNIILDKTMYFWNKRVDQQDLLEARIGIGNVPLEVKVEYPEDDFSMDNRELKKKADELVAKYKYIKNVPMPYSFYKNICTAIMGKRETKLNFINNILTQFLAYYSYEDLKIVVFTNKANETYFDYIKYLNHNFDNEKDFRFFATTPETIKNVSEYLSAMARYREANYKDTPTNELKPYYFIIIDDYDAVKRFSFIKEITESDYNLGFSIVILEDSISKLPSKCNNFISLGEKVSDLLTNSYGNQEKVSFVDEIDSTIDMMALARHISNIPIEFETGSHGLPEVINFLEMEAVGKVEQLNVLNRWNQNDSTQSLRAEIGIDENQDLIYLDLHEKYHGPHGLIAGMTGSGKSEFIITYILSMAINYSPDDVSFILIDYKGGGLAYAFEDKAAGRVLPHLAGTITNLDKAEMDRTLVSIESELKRRQGLFNKARELLGESTIDIYKYQRFYKEGRVEEPIPHLFIICDEFAELKAQQPDFMDSLISTARIGRSLGVHLILATQKPSGVVNDQIWSNTKFRVCLKVQDAQDSKEMLKKPDAASLKETGRFYLQVGYDEYFVLGQSAWGGAKYFPSEKIVKEVDKSINFINDDCEFIKSLQASGNNVSVEAQGEQLAAVLNYVIQISNKVNKKARRLWLENIPDVIIEEEVEKKYGYHPLPYKVEAVIGEYDAPELQKQGLVTFNLLERGNTIVYGNDSVEREMFLNAVIYSTSKNYSPEEINFYMLDFGSESLKIYENLPHFSGYATFSEENRIYNLFTILSDEIAKRKKILAPYGGEYERYIKISKEKMPLLVVMINNFDTLKDSFDTLIYNILPEATRDSYRYGIIYILTGTGTNSVRMNIAQNFKNYYAFKLKDKYDYQTVFSKKKDIMPRDIIGRGILLDEDLHEFQVAYSSLPEEEDEYIRNYVDNIKKKYNKYHTYLPLPTLPDKLRLDDVLSFVNDLNDVPVGISKNTVTIQSDDLISNLGLLISANNFDITIPFVNSLLSLIKNIKNINVIILDPKKVLNITKEDYTNYYNDNFEMVVDSIKNYIDNLIKKESQQKGLLIINGADELVKKLKNDTTKLEDVTNLLKEYEKFGTLIIETNNKYKNVVNNKWVKNVITQGSGIWIGNGISNQSAIMCNTNRTMALKIKDDMGYIIVDNNPELCKLLDFYSDEE